MDLKHLRYFVAVGEELHFRRAAERLHIAQPALSVQIKALEAYLGGKLIARNNRRVELTDTGHLFLKQARQILNQVDSLTRLTRRALMGEIGLLRLAYSGSAAETGILAKVTRSFQRRAADVEIRAAEMHPRLQLAALTNGDIHAALMPTLSLTLPAQLQALKLGEWPLRLALPNNHPLLDKKQIHIADIEQESFVVCAAHDRDDGTSIFRHALGFIPAIGQRVATVNMVIALVGAGLGLGLLPASMASAAKQAGAVLKPVSKVNVKPDLSLVTLRNPQDPVTRQLLAVAQAEFAAR
ncbi:LysR substrate-binding domain-containing protein [Brenneria populi]|uniref:LysR substrate-binding domain-containing protein n=1 Tax=Brenneria populi TaxID=1505588 RepID=A0ABU6JSD9_9GAMM|nr:LysR substrate-binding domain-containing protein [Brenneria populi Li et al. 2015]